MPCLLLLTAADPDPESWSNDDPEVVEGEAGNEDCPDDPEDMGTPEHEEACKACNRGC